MGKGETSRKRILMEAFKLFATMPYERVSFSVMEKEIGISRGSMIYYFKNQEGLFKEVVQTFVYGASSIKAVPDAYKLSLCSFYTYKVTCFRNVISHFCCAHSHKNNLLLSSQFLERSL